MDSERSPCSKCGESYEAGVMVCPKDGTPLGTPKTLVSDDPYLGLTVAGQFRIQQVIGIGAMGRVYRAHQAGIERNVAVKILHRELLRNPTVIARFHREAKVASRLVHPNLVQILMSGELERQHADVGGEAYMVMEYLDGISLRSALAAAGGSLPLPRALHVILQVCDAVGEAHEQGVVHRDLKPENVMLVRRGDDKDFVKVLDFGVARTDFADSSVATQAGVIFGTARYISPEGAQGSPVTAAGDVYSISIMLFQCLSGVTPFDGENPVAILVKHTTLPPPDVRSFPRSSYIPEVIAQAIAVNLSKDPTQRCKNARELGRALAHAARQSGIGADDLVLRSTLLGDSRRDAPQADEHIHADKIEAARNTRAHSESKPSIPTQIDPTLSDETAESVSRPPETRHPSPASLPGALTGSIPPRVHPGAWAQPADKPQLQRLVLIFACFVLGVALAVFVAHRLGAFKAPAAGLQSYTERAEAAIAVNAWDLPPGENVKDITDSALKRWPGAERILRVRREASLTLVRRARQLRDSEPTKAVRFAQLATELDPASERARILVGELTAVGQTGNSAVAPSGEPAVAGPAPAPKTDMTLKARRAPAPLKPAAKVPPAPKPETVIPESPPEERNKETGRWL
ncbi:MAG TPA: serine/threonine-protein kinase [Polyangiaceae bacterium]